MKAIYSIRPSNFGVIVRVSEDLSENALRTTLETVQKIVRENFIGSRFLPKFVDTQWLMFITRQITNRLTTKDYKNLAERTEALLHNNDLPLLKLPAELLCKIAGNLDPRSFGNFGATCRQVRSTLDWRTLERSKELYLLESSEQEHDVDITYSEQREEGIVFGRINNQLNSLSLDHLKGFFIPCLPSAHRLLCKAINLIETDHPDQHKELCSIAKELAALPKSVFDKEVPIGSLPKKLEGYYKQIDEVFKAFPFKADQQETLNLIHESKRLIDCSKAKLEHELEPEQNSRLTKVEVYLRLSSEKYPSIKSFLEGILKDEYNTKDNVDCIYLYAAALSQNDSLLKFLLEKNVNINHTDPDAGSALHLAAENNNPEAIRFLVNHGADVNSLNEDQETPLHVAEGTEAMEVLLELGANVNARDCEGTTPVHYVAQMKDINLLRLFIQKGADINSYDDKALPPLRRAFHFGTKESMRVLLENGAVPIFLNKSKQWSLRETIQVMGVSWTLWCFAFHLKYRFFKLWSFFDVK